MDRPLIPHPALSRERESVRIGGALGFWGDRQDALQQLLEGGPLDYVVMDYLAELTMSILQKLRAKHPEAGFAHDFVPVAVRALPRLRARGARLVASAGGLNPLGCARALAAAAAQAGFPDLKIGVVDGDDLLPRLAELEAAGVGLDHADTGAPRQGAAATLLSANAYLGAFPIAAALAAGAEVVITGRVNDAALALGPLIHEFGWGPDDHDLLAAGTVAGHLLECGAQASGGNFAGGWEAVPALERLGYPVAEVAADGGLEMTIQAGQGGLVTPAVLKEQLLYEIGDPAAYLTPDVRCDVTGLEMTDLGGNRVRITGARGHAPPERYKVSASYADGWQVVAGMVYTWPDALAKATAAAALLLARLEHLGIRHRDHLISYFGANGVHGPMAPAPADPNEVMLRAAFLVDDPKAGERIGREAVTHVLAGIPTATPLEAEVPRPRERVAYWPSLVPRELVAARVRLVAGEAVTELPPVPARPRPAPAAPAEQLRVAREELEELDEQLGREVPLVQLAHGRSGDKGDTLNVGVIARRPEYYPLIADQVTAARVQAHFGHFCRGTVTRYDLPRLQACNFVLTQALGGGGTASLRLDPLGKTYAAALLRLPVRIPADWPR